MITPFKAIKKNKNVKNLNYAGILSYFCVKSKPLKLRGYKAAAVLLHEFDLLLTTVITRKLRNMKTTL